MIRGILFDAAGTLMEPAEPVAETYARLLAPSLGAMDPRALAPRFQCAFSAAGDPDYENAMTGDLAERNWWRSVVESTMDRAISDKAFRDLFDHYARGEAWSIYSEVNEVLQSCSELGLRCGIVSNFDLRLHTILDELELGHAFEKVVTSAEASARKPSARIFALALSTLDLSAAQVVHVGDSSKADIQGAEAAGIRAFHLKRPDEDLTHFMTWVRSQLETK